MRIALMVMGYVLVFGYLAKIGFQMYKKNQQGEKIKFGPNNTIDYEYFKPVRSDGSSTSSTAIMIFNVIHYCVVPYLILSIVYIFIKK